MDYDTQLAGEIALHKARTVTAYGAKFKLPNSLSRAEQDRFVADVKGAGSWRGTMEGRRGKFNEKSAKTAAKEQAALRRHWQADRLVNIRRRMKDPNTPRHIAQSDKSDYLSARLALHNTHKR